MEKTFEEELEELLDKYLADDVGGDPGEIVSAMELKTAALKEQYD